jgi:hypothetical protein
VDEYRATRTPRVTGRKPQNTTQRAAQAQAIARALLIDAHRTEYENLYATVLKELAEEG